METIFLFNCYIYIKSFILSKILFILYKIFPYKSINKILYYEKILSLPVINLLFDTFIFILMGLIFICFYTYKFYIKCIYINLFNHKEYLYLLELLLLIYLYIHYQFL